ncbi:MAG: hypothetical protein LBI64_07820 [Coriobacteriales bacterium]|jgi:hypothetical protein|nr:hypothetical protein [Coriobacteriales bacterium]
MITEKENLTIALDGGIPEWTPLFFNGAQTVMSTAMQDVPPAGSGRGLDWFGVDQVSTPETFGMFTPTVGVPHVLTDITQWRDQVRIPDLESTDWEAVAKRDLETFRIDRENYVFDYKFGTGLFERLHYLMGFEESMIAIALEPDSVYELIGALTDFYIKRAEIIAEFYKPDYFTLMDDYTHISGQFISGTTFDALFAPHIKRIVDFVATTDMKFKLHCCGRAELLLDNFYRIGIRRFDPVQPCNDLADMRRRYPDISLMGGLDLQGVTDHPRATEEDIRKEVRRCVDEYGPLGGYVMYCCTIYKADPQSYLPGGRMFFLMDEASSYAKCVAGAA